MGHFMKAILPYVSRKHLIAYLSNLEVYLVSEACLQAIYFDEPYNIKTCGFQTIFNMIFKIQTDYATLWKGRRTKLFF